MATDILARNIGAAFRRAGGGGGGPSVKDTTYSELLDLCDNGMLTPGQLYRITDYETIINGTYDLSDIVGQTAYVPYATTANHQFDLIVGAISESELDEHAIATHNESDTYFENSDLESWEIKYDIHNSTKYAWADTTNGKGVIYYMKDEFNNEAGYDFKNIQFVAYALKCIADVDDPRGNLLGFLVYDENEQQLQRYGSPIFVIDAISRYIELGEYTSPWVANGNVPIDFSVEDTIVNVRNYNTIDGTFLETFNANLYYTFDILDSSTGEHSDGSLNSNGIRVHDNSISPCQDYLSPQYLDNFIFGLNMTIFENDLNDWCEYNKTNHSAIGNIFGGSCYCNTVLSLGSGNIFGSGLGLNILGDDCCNNILDFCFNIKINTESHVNIIGNQCQNIVLEANCSNNYIFDNVMDSDLNTNCSNNTIGSSCSNINMNNSCTNTHIGSSCRNINIDSDCNDNTIGESCECINIGKGCVTNIIGMGYDDVLAGNVRYTSLEDNVANVILKYADAESQANPITNYHICKSVQGEDNDPLVIVAVSARNFETWVGYDSDGNLNTWCPADSNSGLPESPAESGKYILKDDTTGQEPDISWEPDYEVYNGTNYIVYDGQVG